MFKKPNEISNLGATPLRSPIDDALGDGGSSPQLPLRFYSLVQDLEIGFEAFLTSYSDAFNSNWNSETVYGRMDPLYTFQNTQRAINLSFTVANVTSNKISTGVPNNWFAMERINKFFQFLYPRYQSANNALSINQAPLVRIRFGNMICNSSTTSVGTAKEGGLLAVITSLTMTPQVEHGFSKIEQNGQLLTHPNFLDLSVAFNVVHEKDKLYNGSGETANLAFPYGDFNAGGAQAAAGDFASTMLNGTPADLSTPPLTSAGYDFDPLRGVSTPDREIEIPPAPNFDGDFPPDPSFSLSRTFDALGGSTDDPNLDPIGSNNPEYWR